MKFITTIFLSLFCAAITKAQTGFRTVVPQQAIIAGESFLVQYILDYGDKTMQVMPPVFSNFRVVTGPNISSGNVSTTDGVISVLNTIVTLEATRPGKFLIPGATVTINGKTRRSNDAWVEVISEAEALKRFNAGDDINASDYFLRPGENPYQKIQQNLFVKMMVDKRSCFVGEPVVATFKLYSRLESRSDIIKNPGFYGFTVYDMVNLSDKKMRTEKINGKLFDVHTIRKVQLFPLQEGLYTIDAMEVLNDVEFSRSVVNKKTEQYFQEVNRRHILREGILNKEESLPKDENAEVFETKTNTEPVTIRVKPIPEKNKPALFNGAVGKFNITSQVANPSLRKNEEGFFEVVISGKGNFIQLSAPLVHWPAGVEGFEPVVKDTFDKTKTPLAGTRIFRFPFVCASAGNWQIPPVSLSFFDTDSNSYKTISTKGVEVVSSNESKPAPVEGHNVSIAEKSEKAARTAGIIVAAIVLVILFYWIFKKKEPEPVIQAETEPALPTADQLLEPATAAIAQEGNLFYRLLHKGIWDFAVSRFELAGSDMSKQTLIQKMKAAGVGQDTIKQVFDILEQCEAGMFTTASLEHDKESLVSFAKQLLGTIDAPGSSSLQNQ